MNAKIRKANQSHIETLEKESYDALPVGHSISREVFATGFRKGWASCESFMVSASLNVEVEQL